MGISISSPSSRDIITTKVENAYKTGVLNLAKLEIKSNSQVWTAISSPELSVKIKVLDLSCNPLKSLPLHIALLEHIKSLHLSKCCLQRIPNLSMLSELKKLDLDNNDLEETTIVQLPISLISLNLSFNHIICYPEALHVLSNLQVLDISSNRLENVEFIGYLSALVTLNLDNNQLVDLPDTFEYLRSIKKISVKNNLFIPKSPTRNTQCIPAKLLESTPLMTIELHGNKYLKNDIVLKFDGMESFITRRFSYSELTFYKYFYLLYFNFLYTKGKTQKKKPYLAEL